MDRSELNIATSTLSTLAVDQRVNCAPDNMIVDNPSVSCYISITNNMQH